ncbi:MAG TPA: ABC transporter ATP-binding protein, partial [Nitrososphaeraceae archaeon]|nr:ABC transporter ATP-binding protein [Nitrososphaeraceae archaeon]
MIGDQYCISVHELWKYYNRDIAAINGISLDVEYGKVFGFLGPNGAGKTTTIKILTTLFRPSSGKVYLFGKDIVKHSAEVRKRIGVVLQQPSFEANLTVERALDLYGFLWGLASEKRKDRLRELLHAFDLESLRNTKNDELSIGQRRRVQVAREFMHEMDLLFLDEPTVGLDPSARRMLLDYIKRQVKAGLTVFFTTHIMEEAEYLCDEIAIINKGKILAFDTPAGLKQKYGGIKTIEIKLKNIPVRSILHLINRVVDNTHISIPETKTICIGSINAQEI